MDVPPVVVKQQVMEFAEQDAVFDVGVPVVAFPVVDVVRFAPGGRSVAAGPEASAVSHPEADALPGGEEALGSSDVDALAVVVEGDGDRSGVAELLVDGGQGDGFVGSFNYPAPTRRTFSVSPLPLSEGRQQDG